MELVVFRWFVYFINRVWFCRRNGHILDYEHAKPVVSINKNIVAVSTWCLACKKEFYCFDIESYGFKNTLDN